MSFCRFKELKVCILANKPFINLLPGRFHAGFGMQSPLICCGTTNHDMSTVCIYPKDLCKPLRIGQRQAQRVLREVRKALNKEKHQYITVEEFCEYMGLSDDLFRDVK